MHKSNYLSGGSWWNWGVKKLVEEFEEYKSSAFRTHVRHGIAEEYFSGWASKEKKRDLDYNILDNKWYVNWNF